jgi:pyridoxine/pyridoxamine 5'-phosphate oxidase
MRKSAKTKAKEGRIKEEERRLIEIYADIDEKKKNTVQGLIQRAAYMCVSLEDMEKDIDLNGFTEKFSQSESQKPYDRKRPIADLYNTMNSNYQKAINQLTSLLPKEAPKLGQDDGFDDFVSERDGT